MIVALAAIHAGDEQNVIGKGGGPRHKTLMYLHSLVCSYCNNFKLVPYVT